MHIVAVGDRNVATAVPHGGGVWPPPPKDGAALLQRCGLTAATDDEDMSAFTAHFELERVFDAPLAAYELPTMSRMHAAARTAQLSDASEDRMLLYTHSKGVGNRGPSRTARDDWRRFMLYHLAERPCACLSRLLATEPTSLGVTCGVDLWIWPHLCYAGSFWWARAKYVAAPPHPASLFDVGAAPNHFGDPRHGLEFWLGGDILNLKQPKTVAGGIALHYSLLHSGIDCMMLAETPNPRSRYANDSTACACGARHRVNRDGNASIGAVELAYSVKLSLHSADAPRSDAPSWSLRGMGETLADVAESRVPLVQVSHVDVAVAPGLRAQWRMQSEDVIDEHAVKMAAEHIQHRATADARFAVVTSTDVASALRSALRGKCRMIAWFGDEACGGPFHAPEPVGLYPDSGKCCFEGFYDEGGDVFAMAGVPTSEDDGVGRLKRWHRVPADGRSGEGTQSGVAPPDRAAASSRFGASAYVGAWTWRDAATGACGDSQTAALAQGLATALPMLFPSVAESGRGVVDCGGGAGGA